MTARLVHLITPGDHYSPSTGSAVPSVVHGISSAAGRDRSAVLVARGTYADRYDSAETLEYDDVPATGTAARYTRYTDAAAGRVLGVRPTVRRRLRSALAGQSAWTPGVVLAHNLPQAVPLVDRRRHVPVLYAHNDLLRSYSRREAGLVTGNAAAVVCVSEHLAQVTADRLPREGAAKVAVVPNGVDAALFAAPRRPDDGVLDVVFIGRTIPDKGVHVLVDAVTRLDRPDVRLTVVGGAGFAPDAPLTAYEQDLRRRAAAAGDRITFHPFVTRAQVPRVLARADVAVVPSTWPDPCPLTVLEGAASGAAVVASRTGGIPEIAGPGAVLVRPGDVDELAAALEALADDPTELHKRQEAAAAHGARSTWDRTARRLDATLDHLTG
ncbi:glycosyltransferase family 4 protein [Isoptericola dokdonensis]|uniref:Spore coat protein SA n=1 Tax=Isoptericola dokdonensis DS-3 TaxID=1300344 RepID=A0A168FY96_9MICO|nr:glycosyltransferase family 4 protein [Isoptericola dokdonensis]ANC32720.1 Spore coat protein SA [Isoptericola dokdonensis DS-3]